MSCLLLRGKGSFKSAQHDPTEHAPGRFLDDYTPLEDFTAGRDGEAYQIEARLASSNAYLVD